MDAVVLHSDIARLVLGYLKRQNLERTSRLFCKTSPHLKQEFSAYRKGYTPHTFGPDLEDIICEYVNITCTVDRLVSSLPSSLRFQLFERKLSEKVNLLLERALDSFLKAEQSESSALKKSDVKRSSAASTSVPSDKENTTKKQNKQKRKRTCLIYSSDERKSPVSLQNKLTKRRRILEPFCYLSAKQKHNLQRLQKESASSTGDEQTQTDDGVEDESADEEDAEVLDNESDLSIREKPTQESTPRNISVKGKFLTPSVPDLSQAILDNPHFQMKLVDNINQALSSSVNPDGQAILSNINSTTANIQTNTDTLSEEQQIINSNEMLDQMVQDILKATEKDPAFDAIIENVVGASVQSTNVSAGVQCHIDSNQLQSQLGLPTVPPLLGQQQQQLFTLVQQQPQQSLNVPCLAAISHETAASTTTPRTPLLIRTAVAAASTSHSGGGDASAGESQVLSALTSNNSFGSLIDPNFSISKLIVLNPNDGAQKPSSADQSIGNTTADQLITQLTSSGAEATGDEQVFFDANTGQLTIPLFLTDEGLLANFPFLVNNEAVTQQLQTDNICNMDGSRIEIPLPEPIIVSADQLPPNSIIVTSAQKAITVEEQRLPGAQQPPRTVCKKTMDGPAPSSLNVRSNADGETPSTSGIVNSKAYKSLSTPRKRTSHVRTLSFSPKVEGNRIAAKAGATPLSTRRDAVASTTALLEDGEVPENFSVVPEKPIIKNVEILPRLDGTIDVSANESSNSCSVPPLFVTEESSNQTVIKTELSLKESKEVSLAVQPKATATSKSTIADHPDTPKRKQVRRSAVRACKRRLSKSSDELKLVTKNQTEKIEPIESVTEGKEQTIDQRKLNDDKMMEEWLRLRNASTSDLDSRLRQLNAEQNASIPKSARRVRSTPAKKRKLRQKKAVVSKRRRKKAAALALLDHERKISLNASVEVDESKEGNESDQLPVEEAVIKEKDIKSKRTREKKRTVKDRSMEFNIKIPTPQKDKRESLLKMRSERTTSDTDELATHPPADAADSPTLQNRTERTEQCKPTVQRTENRLEHERDRRTANIACLLETPFKAPTTLGEVPPTPGMPVPILDTPASKLGDIPLSTSYLFGSLTKSELETPQLSAITPGIRFTPFGSSRDVTPRSVAPATDYSSGGSYYKPDESDDLDRKFDKLLKDSAQKQKQKEEEKQSHAAEVKNLLFEDQRETTELHMEQKQDAICVEIPAEKLRVEPIVLKRVKSFGAEGTEDGEGATASINIDPHYMLASELPEICAEEESSNSSSTFSSSSSSSSSNSSSSSSSSSSDSSAALHKATAKAEEQKKSPDNNLRLSLDNLSSISSTEDEEWQKLAVTEEENSQLVGNDGEVRYPVRSWLTPSKVEQHSARDAQERVLPTIIKVTVPLKSAEKKNRLEEDLQQKRERMMEKLKRDANQGREKRSNVPSTPPSGITAALSATRKIAAMREKGKSQPTKSPLSAATSTTLEPHLVQEEKRTMEVLTALQLSARKSQQTRVSEPKTRTSAIAPLISALDDNATSTLFSSATTSSSITTTYELTEKSDRLPLKTLISKVKAKQRQCLRIEALPVLKSTRSSGAGRKKIVRNPLGFKGTTAGEAVEIAGRIDEVKSPRKLAEKVRDDSDGSSEDMRAGISPVPKIKIKTTTTTAATSSKIRVSPRLKGIKNAKPKDCDADDLEEVPTKPIKKLKTTKSMKTRATTAKSLLGARIKISPGRPRITKSQKATQNMQCEAARLAIEHAPHEDTVPIQKPVDAEVPKTGSAQKEVPAKETVVNTQNGDKTENDKKSADIAEEGKQSGKPTKTFKTPLESMKFAKDAEQAKTNTDVPKAKEVADQTEGPKAKPTKPNKHLPHEKSVAPENTEKGDAVKKGDMPKPKRMTTESDSRAADILKAKLTKPEIQSLQKAESADKQKWAVQTGNIEAQQKSTAPKTRETVQTIEECPATPTSTTNMEPATTETSEDDPLEGCELVTVTDEDPVRFISVTYDGPDMPPPNPLPRRDFTNFKMVVAFDEDEKHIWRVSDDLMLFHLSPATQQIRNIPKKRKVRINTCSSDQDDVAMVGVVHSTTTTLATATTTSTLTPGSSTDIDKNASSSTREIEPVATSTPISAPATSSTQESQKLLSKPTTSAAAATKSTLPTKPTTKSSAGTTEVLQMDDIESLLSHLHGNAN
ncbi:PREDICTED: serine-rich adhesin for platelets-like [Rhagoletis zephyria]|uniref:serine-rich adhesin for platelets-like n=1 Tax=Rhagoletis zephyria TaxID=28612 RepID=UPI0008117FBB|nr:PREDICTED: serine-rich adhesin for platelets-like [Rhagoletis zephyria]